MFILHTVALLYSDIANNISVCSAMVEMGERTNAMFVFYNKQINLIRKWFSYSAE